jgi:hypothetical protein
MHSFTYTRKTVDRNTMFNPASSQSQWISRLTGTADKLLLSACLELCLYTHACVCVFMREWEWREQQKRY